MTPAQLATIGRALYGARWQTALARDLGIAPRVMRYLEASERDIPKDFPKRLAALCYARVASLQKVTRELRVT